MKKIYLLLTALMMAEMTFAYDFTVVDNYGNNIYLQFSVTGEDFLEVTNSGTYGSYTGTVEIPSEILATKPGDTSPKMLPVAVISDEAFRECHGLTKIILPTSLTDIRNLAFFECDNLQEVTIPGGVKNIWSMAFANCSNLTEVTCLADERPMVMDSSVFCTRIDTIHYPAGDEYMFQEVETLKVPNQKLAEYRSPSLWIENFANIVGIDCGISVVEELKSSSAEIKWKPDERVSTFIITVYQGDSLYAQYIMDGEGKEISHEKFAHKADTTVNSTTFYVITLDGLTENTSYSYTVHGFDNQSMQVYQDNGSFKTKSKDEDGIEQITNDQVPMTNKFLRDGVLIIERNGHRYTVEGKEMP